MKIKNNSLIPLCGITAIFGGMLNGIIGTVDNLYSSITGAVDQTVQEKNNVQKKIWTETTIPSANREHISTKYKANSVITFINSVILIPKVSIYPHKNLFAQANLVT